VNAFERHGITHLSPSACNSFVASQAMFVLTRVLKKANAVGAAAHRGTAAETGIAHGLMNSGASLTACVEAAVEHFKILTSMSTDPRLEKERESIAGFVEQGLLALKPYGQPSAVQSKAEFVIDGIPFLGYIDFEWAASKIILDLKTAHVVSNSIKPAHARQVAFYVASRGAGDTGRVAYVTPKKSAVLALENVSEHVAALGKIGKTIERFLSISDDPLELASLVVPDVDSFYFNDPLIRQQAFEIWGI